MVFLKLFAYDVSMIVYDVDHQEMMFKVINKLQKHATHVKKQYFRHVFEK